MADRTACASCTRFKRSDMWAGVGACSHPDGPVRVRTLLFLSDRQYPVGCPIDPCPPPPPRKRPLKKKRGRGPKHRPDVRGGVPSAWDDMRPRLPEMRAPTVAEDDS